MHAAYDTGADGMRYVLATFVVPRRWLADYGWRPLSDVEVRASVRDYRELGRLLGVPRVPETYPAFEQLLDARLLDASAFAPPLTRDGRRRPRRHAGRTRLPARLPARRHARHSADLPRTKSSRGGYRIEDLGGFPAAVTSAGRERHQGHRLRPAPR